MRKYLALAVLLCMILTACINRYEYPAASTEYESNCGLQAVPVGSNEFGMSFLMRNGTGARLYYNDDYRIGTTSMSNTNNRAGVLYINHGNTKDVHVNWPGPRRSGIFTFERDFFLDSGLTELYTTLTFDFYIVGWEHNSANNLASPIPEYLQAKREAQARESLAFQVAGGASDIIVLASEVAVSRTGVMFNTANMSKQPFIHGEGYRLLIYDNGWRNAPAIVDSFLVHLIAIPMRGGEVIEDSFNFEWWHGALENGRYMLMRHHHEDHMRPGAPRVQETLMVEFVIDDGTPMSLNGALPAAAGLSAYVSDITPTGLLLIFMPFNPTAGKPGKNKCCRPCKPAAPARCRIPHTGTRVSYLKE